MEGYSVSSVISSLLLNILNIVALYLILRGLVYKPVKKFLTARQDRIQKGMDQAASVRTEAEQIHQQYLDQLSHAAEDADKKSREILQKAEDASRAIQAQAETEGQALIKHAREQAQREHDDAMLQLRREAAGVAVEIASRVLEREVSETDNSAIVTKYFDELDAQKGGRA